MPQVNIRGRAFASAGWFFVFLTVFVTQAINALEFNNHLQHLTNWAWIFHGVVAGWRCLSPNVPYIATIIAFGLSLFVAGGIASIQFMDDSMLKHFEKQVGASMVAFANFVMHYLPPIFWTFVLAFEKTAIRKYYKKYTLPTNLTQSILGALTLPVIYSLLFRLQEQYPGANINFTILFVASAMVISIGFSFLVAFAQT
jgi:hypothetical protein